MPTRRPATSSHLGESGQGAADPIMEPTADTQKIPVSGIVDAILEVGRQRNALLTQLRAALQSDQDNEALAIARQLCGISNHEESHRVNPCIN